MTAYFIRRFLLIIPTFIGITLLVFAVTRLVPGGPIERILQEAAFSADETSQVQSGVDTRSGTTLSDEQLAELNAFYGFDKPILESYVIWLGKVVTFDLGESTRYQDPVWEIIKERLPISTFYGISTLILTYLVCIPLGMSKAMRHGGIYDNWSSALVFLGYAVPGYIVGIAGITFFASHWEIFPLGGFVSDDFSDYNLWQQIKDILWHAVLPLTAYMAGGFAVTTFMMKNALMDNLSADYMRTAVAKGLSKPQAVRRHALRNSLIPIATSFGENIAFFMSGSFLIETIFNIDGIGLLGYEAVVQRDYPVVMGILAITAMLQLLGNILSDVCVAIVDPRIRFGGGQ